MIFYTKDPPRPHIYYHFLHFTVFNQFFFPPSLFLFISFTLNPFNKKKLPLSILHDFGGEICDVEIWVAVWRKTRPFKISIFLPLSVFFLSFLFF